MWKVTLLLLFAVFSTGAYTCCSPCNKGNKISVSLFCEDERGIKCYDCNSSTDPKCLDEVTSATTVECDGYCLIVRGEKGGVVVSFDRLCSQTGMNEEKEVNGTKVVSQSCKTDLCNDGYGSKVDTTAAGTAATVTGTAATGTETAATGTGTAATGTGTETTQTAATTKNTDSGLKCYICVWTMQDSSCVNDVESVPVVTCNDTCAIQRIEDIETGDLLVFLRGCSQYNESKYDATETNGKRYIFQTCDSEKCNSGHRLAITGIFPILISVMALKRII